MRPETVNFWIRVILGAGSRPTDSQMAALKDALYRDFYGLNQDSDSSRIGLASTVFASRFYTPALAVEGIRNIQSVEIALSADAPTAYNDVLAINGDQEPVLATDNIDGVVA